MAAADAVVPLSTPIVTSSGKTLTEVRIKKGRTAVISITGYNRQAPSLFDVHTWVQQGLSNLICVASSGCPAFGETMLKNSIRTDGSTEGK